MNNKIHRCKLIIDIEHADRHEIITQCRSLFYSSIKYDCANIIEEMSRLYSGDVNIESINIELGDMSYDMFKSQFRDRFIQAFRKQLSKHCLTQRKIRQKDVSNASSYNTSFSNETQMLSLYLQHGNWPMTEKWQRDPATWLSERLVSEPEKWYPFMMSACLQALSRYRLRRLIEQNPILQHYCAWPTLEDNLLLYALCYFQSNAQHQAAYLTAPEAMLPTFYCEQDETKCLLMPLLSSIDIATSSLSPSTSPVLNAWVSKLLEQSSISTLAEQEGINVARLSERAENEPCDREKYLTENKGTQLSRQTKGNLSEKVMKEAPLLPVPVSNAGLILLWPLLPSLFESAGLYNKGRFVSVLTQYQAASWLDWIVWQEEAAQQSRMVFSYWLCGLQMEETSEVYPPTPEMKEKALHWLAQLPTQLSCWNKLNPQDICQLFLQRSGKIVIQEGNVTLYVDSEPWDFLLRECPWLLNRLELPWIMGGLDIDWPILQDYEQG